MAIYDHEIEQVSSFKYLGVYVDSDLGWHTQVTSVCTRVHLRFLCRFRLFGVSKHIISIFFRAVIELIFRYGMTSWFANLTVQSKAQKSSLVRTAGKMMGTCRSS